METTRRATGAAKARVTRIVHPTDFSASSERAYTYATLLQQLTGAELHLLHVVPFPEDVRPSEKELRQACLTANDQLRAAAGNAATTTTAVRIGKAHAEITRYVGETKADLVIMGTVGLSGDASTQIGSIAEKVIRSVSVPVLTIKAAAKSKPSGKVCALCAAPSTEVICGACNDRVRGEAVSRKHK